MQVNVTFVVMQPRNNAPRRVEDLFEGESNHRCFLAPIVENWLQRETPKWVLHDVDVQGRGFKQHGTSALDWPRKQSRKMRHLILTSSEEIYPLAFLTDDACVNWHSAELCG